MMVLSFKTHWDKTMGVWAGKPTNFMMKILKGLNPEIDGHVRDAIFSEYFDSSIWDSVKQKRHTFREDGNDRWHPGRKIHFAVNNRSPEYLQFAPIVPCMSVQQIAIVWLPIVEVSGLEGEPSTIMGNNVWVIVDARILKASEIKKLAINDGFESVEQFFAWFHADFEGKIIHWTNLKY